MTSDRQTNLDRTEGETLELFIQQLTETHQLSKGLYKALQDEMLVNAKIRTELQRDLHHLKLGLEELHHVLLKGNGQKSLVNQVAILQSEFHTLERRFGEVKVDSLHPINELDKLEKRFKERIAELTKAINVQLSNLKNIFTDKLKTTQEALEERIEIIIGEKDRLEERSEKHKDRWWALLVEMLPHLITWTAIGLFLLRDHLAKNP